MEGAIRYSLALVGTSALVALLVTGFQNCSGAKFSANQVTSGGGPGNGPGGGPGGGPLNGPICGKQAFTQPSVQITNKVDIVFVMHPTTSYAATAYGDISSGLQGAIAQFPANADYRVSTISALEFVSDPTISGQAFGTVFTPQNLTATALENQMKNPQTGTSHGETGESALIAALTTQLPFNQNAGALRQGAVLSVFFLANEADLCGLPAADPGTDADYAAEYAETLSKCPNVSPASTLATVQNYAKANGAGFTLSGIIYTDKAITATATAEREYGWGYYQLIHDLIGGPLIDLNSGDTNIANAITAAASQASYLFNVKTDFTVTDAKVNPSSIAVHVSGAAQPVPANEVSFNNGIVHISNPADAGAPGSTVTVSYCEQ